MTARDFTQPVQPSLPQDTIALLMWNDLPCCNVLPQDWHNATHIGLASAQPLQHIVPAQSTTSHRCTITRSAMLSIGLTAVYSNTAVLLHTESLTRQARSDAVFCFIGECCCRM